MDACRLQRLDESASKSECDTVLVPLQTAPPGRETELARFRKRFAVEIGQQHARGFVIADMFARIDVAIPDAVLKRDAPLPAGLSCGRACKRLGIACPRTRNSDSAIAAKPMRQVLISGFQRLLDEETAEARTVDEEFAIDPRAVSQGDRFDEAILAAKNCVDDPALTAHHTASLGIAPEIACIEGRIEVIGVFEA